MSYLICLDDLAHELDCAQNGMQLQQMLEGGDYRLRVMRQHVVRDYHTREIVGVDASYYDNKSTKEVDPNLPF